MNDIQHAQLARMWATKDAKLSDFLVETKHLMKSPKQTKVSNSWEEFLSAVKQHNASCKR